MDLHCSCGCFPMESLWRKQTQHQEMHCHYPSSQHEANRIHGNFLVNKTFSKGLEKAVTIPPTQISFRLWLWPNLTWSKTSKNHTMLSLKPGQGAHAKRVGLHRLAQNISKRPRGETSSHGSSGAAPATTMFWSWTNHQTPLPLVCTKAKPARLGFWILHSMG